MSFPEPRASLRWFVLFLRGNFSPALSWPGRLELARSGQGGPRTAGKGRQGQHFNKQARARLVELE